MFQDKMLIYFITIISLIAGFSFSLSPFFQIHDIQFASFKILTNGELDKAVQAFYHENIFLLERKKVDRRLREIPYVKETRVNKRYPDQLIITIDEYIPLAKINNHGSYLTFNQEGYILEKGPVKTRVPVPEIAGVGYTLDGKMLSFSPELEKIVQALTMMDRTSREMLSRIVYSEDGIINAYSYQIPIKLGSSEKLIKKMEILHSILKKIKEKDIRYEYIDLSILQKPVIKLINE